MCFLLFLVTVNNYVDRQIFSVAAPAISAEFHLRAADIAAIVNFFLFAYAFGHVDWSSALSKVGDAARRAATASPCCWVKRV